MTLHKLQHFFSHIFLLILVVLQGLIFVASQASNTPEFEAIFLSPQVNQSLTAGQTVSLKANLIAEETNFSIVYFQVKNSEANIDLNFEAQQQADQSWQSLAAWDTTGFAAGHYTLSAIAYFYDNSGQVIKNLVSNSQPVYLAYPVEMSQVEEDGQLPTTPDPEPEKETPTVLSASIISPNLDTVSSTIDLIVEFNQQLLDNQDVSAYLIFGTSTQATLDLESLDNVQYSTALDTTKYQNGDYNLVFYIDNDDIVAIDLSIDNQVLPAIELVSPLENIIDHNSFVVNLTTNFLAENLSIEFINGLDPAISTGELAIAKTDGYNWSKTLNLGASFVDGDYKLIAKSGEITNTFELALNLVDETIGWPDSPGQIVLELYALGPNLSGTVLAQASSTFSGLAVDFVAKDTASQAEVGHFESVYFGNMYGANIDTLTLPNGNYYLSAQTVFQDTTVESNSILVSIFNPSQEQNIEPQATTTPSTTPEQVIINNNNQAVIVQAQGPLFSRQTTCLSAGILDEKNCLIFRGLLDETLDAKCIAQNILEPLACEDYLNLVYVEGDCKSAGIIDHEQCKDYLLEKYAGSIDCRLDDQNMCRDILRNTYLNRLVLDIKKQENINANLASSIGQNISLESLTQSFADISLPLAIGEVLVLPSNNEIVLAQDNSLTIANGLLMVLDTDRDQLPDDLEVYYGTDPQNQDSDADGYTDAVEVKNNYNPNGEGALTKARTDLDQVILSNQKIRQPKLSAGNIDNILQVQSIENIDDKIKLAGLALPNTRINLFIYSDIALLASVETDESGHWSYTMPQNMSDGHHRVYLAVNDLEGKIVSQSAPASFLVKSAKAVTAEEFFGAGLNTQVETDNWTMYYVIGGGILLVILTIIISYLFVHRSKNSYNPL